MTFLFVCSDMETDFINASPFYITGVEWDSPFYVTDMVGDSDL